MGLELKGDELNLLVLTASSALSAWFDELESLRSNFEAFTESDSIKGQAADSMKTYIDEVHISCLLPLIENLLNDFSSKLSVYDYKYSEIDGDCHKHLNEDAIGSAKEDYRSDGIRDCEDEFGQVLGSISDIVEISNPDPDDIGNDCARIRFRLEKLGNEIVQHENETRSSGTATLEELISSVSELVRSAVSRPSSTLTSYQTGDLIQLSGLEEAYENTLSSVSYNENNSGTIEAARQYESNMMEQLQEEEAAREQENRITGILEVIGAGITIAIGVAAIVTTMGAAAPLVVGAEEAILDITLATSGITSCLMGASDMIEGIGTVVTGKGYNIGRDFLFGGDSGTYNTVETAATTAALILNPIASAVKAGESLSVKVVATSIGRYEIANASCIINSKLADGIGATFNLDETQTQVIELGLNVIENTALKRKTGITEQSGESSGSKISSSSASEEQLKINADTARKDLNLRTQAAVENNNSQLYEGGSGSLIDIDKIRPQLKTEPDTAFFWSGRTEGIGGADTAANIAKGKGGVTLESTIEAKKIVMPEWDFNNPSTMEAWDLASGAYAEQVSGEIRAVVGSELRTGNIWENIELPRLKANPNVTKITIIDPKTQVETIIFKR